MKFSNYYQLVHPLAIPYSRVHVPALSSAFNLLRDC
jgi:hypothetical protein